MTDEPSEIELPRAVALAWGVAATPQRGPKREMSVERIVEAAIEIADAEGLGAVAMGRVAGALGFTPMSLYRYVTAKDELIALMQDAGTGLPPERDPQVPAPEADDAYWKTELRRLAHAQLERYLEHPWLLDIPIEGTPVTPNNLAWMDAMLDALEGLPFDEVERAAVMLLVTGITRWQGIVFRGYLTAAASGMGPDSIDDARTAILDHLVTADEFPAVRRALDGGAFSAQSPDPFAWGFERILDGVEERIAAGAASAGSSAPGQESSAEPPADVSTDKRVREKQRKRRELEKLLRAARKEERAAIREARARLAE